MSLPQEKLVDILSLKKYPHIVGSILSLPARRNGAGPDSTISRALRKACLTYKQNQKLRTLRCFVCIEIRSVHHYLHFVYFMACDAVTDFLTREQDRFLTPILNQRVFPRSIWLTIMRRGEWMPAMGTTLNTLRYERSAPTEAEPAWAAVSVSDGAEGGSCLPPVTKIGVASTYQSFNLARIAREGPDICNIDIMPAFDLQNQLKSVGKILGDYALIEWEIRYRHEYFRLTQTKIVLTSACTLVDGVNMSENMATTYPAVCASAPLHLKVLRQMSIALMRDGAGSESLLRSNGAPLLNVITDSESAGNLIREQHDIREDISRGNQNSLLVGRFGVTYAYGGFVFLIDTTPRRFNCVAGVHTEVPVYTLTPASGKGQKAEINDNWKTAAETETFIFDPRVVTILIPRPPTAPAPNFTFDPVNYTGEVTLMNIRDRVCNPMGNIIYHRLDMMAASMPEEPERGVSILHLRCDPEGCVTSCAS